MIVNNQRKMLRNPFILNVDETSFSLLVFLHFQLKNINTKKQTKVTFE